MRGPAHNNVRNYMVRVDSVTYQVLSNLLFRNLRCDISSEEFRYEAVAVVHNNLSISSLQDLKGLKSCHTGVGRNVGYKIPITKVSRHLETCIFWYMTSCRIGLSYHSDAFPAEVHPQFFSGGRRLVLRIYIYIY